MQPFLGPDLQAALPKQHIKPLLHSSNEMPQQPDMFTSERLCQIALDRRRQMVEMWYPESPESRQERDDFERVYEKNFGKRPQSRQQASRDWHRPVPDPFDQRRDVHGQQGREAEASRSYQLDNQVTSAESQPSQRTRIRSI